MIALARAQLGSKQPANALRTINSMPIHLVQPAPRPEVVPLPGDASSSSSSAVDGLADAAAALSLSSSDQAAGAGEKEAVTSDVYRLLAEMARDGGWERLLEVRSRAFVLEGDDEEEEAAAVEVGRDGRCWR